MWPKDVFTRFEVARLLGARSLQIALGAPVLVKTDLQDPLAIAKQEFRECRMPITIKRRLPNNQEIVVDVKVAIKNWLSEGREL
jgi:DNA-directed RNA polymerase subunit K